MLFTEDEYEEPADYEYEGPPILPVIETFQNSVIYIKFERSLPPRQCYKTTQRFGSLENFSRYQLTNSTLVS